MHLISSLVYLYSLAEIGQWNITSGDTVMVLLASDAALDNQTEVRGFGLAMGQELAGLVCSAPLSLALPPGSSTEVLGP